MSEFPLGLTCSPCTCRLSGDDAQLLGIERHRLTLRDIARIEEIADRQPSQCVLEMHDQRLARKHLQRRRGIQIVSRHRSVGGRAADHRVAEDEHVLDGLRHRVEAGVPLMRGERHLQDAVLARQRNGLAVLGPHCRIEVGDCVLTDGVLRFDARRVPDRSERKDDGHAACDDRVHSSHRAWHHARHLGPRWDMPRKHVATFRTSADRLHRHAMSES